MFSDKKSVLSNKVTLACQGDSGEILLLGEVKEIRPFGSVLALFAAPEVFDYARKNLSATFGIGEHADRQNHHVLPDKL